MFYPPNLFPWRPSGLHAGVYFRGETDVCFACTFTVMIMERNRTTPEKERQKTAFRYFHGKQTDTRPCSSPPQFSGFPAQSNQRGSHGATPGFRRPWPCTGP